MIKNVTNEAKTPSSGKEHSPRTENCGLKKNDGIAQLMKKEKKKPMEDYKRMQCWMILKRMIEGRDG
ncbi:global transcription factor group, partial [Trifolium medium]|nr:global transcription factor group [Trifolium medium]